MAETIKLNIQATPRTNPEGPATEVPIREEKTPEFNTAVQFDNINGFHLKDTTGQYVYPLNGILQNIIVQTIKQVF